MSPQANIPPIVYCARCNEPFKEFEDMARTSQDEFWHLRCFVCAQCFKPFNNNHEYYEFGGKKYCEKDFCTLFAPCCSKCNQFIIGRFIRALNKSWHPNCFQCENCQISLADHGFINSKTRTLCHDCNYLEKSVNKNQHVCYRCKQYIGGEGSEEEKPLRYKDDTYHAYHFNCHSCGIELMPDARQVDGELYCLKCHDNMDIPICGACRRPIEERVVTALGKKWHKEHFACADCEKPFLGKRHFEVKGLAYCQEDYYRLFGHQCHTCSQTIQSGDVIAALGKYYCSNHFICYLCCAQLIANKSKFYDVGTNACCKTCYKKLPASLRKKLAKEKKAEKKLN